MTDSNDTNTRRCKELLISMRKIIQAIDIHSRTLNKKFGLTGPQLVVLQEIFQRGQVSITPLSKVTSLSQATITDITKRLETKGLIARKKREDDRRAVSLFLTQAGLDILKGLPSPLQDSFTNNFSELEDWEQMMILSAFERVVSLMSAEKIQPFPIMLPGHPESDLPDV